MSEDDDSQHGLAYAFSAYLFWGVAPAYFVWVAFAGPLEILSQRILWSIPLLALLITVGAQWRQVAHLDRRKLGLFLCCALLLAANWLTFIYGVSMDRIAETALGYFINPLFTIALGAIFLGEKLSRWQIIAVVLALLGVGYELVSLGGLPWIALTLAVTFGFYGLLRKRLQVPAALGLGIETLMVAPLAIGFLLIADLPERTLTEGGMLALGGVVTVVPLVLFGAAALRLPLTTLGFIQYLAPSISLAMAVLIYQEELPFERWVNFAFVWAGIGILSYGSLRNRWLRSELR